MTTTIVTRAGKGSPLTFTEADANFTNLQTSIDDFIVNVAASTGSSLVGFVQSGTGATARTAQAKMRDIVDIRDFGAVCDGTTDDYTAINNALNSGALQVQIPYNTAIGTKLTIPAGVELIGLGRPSIFKLGNIDMIDMSANATRLRSLRLEGAGATYTGRGIIIGAGSDAKIIDVDVADMNGYCLEFTTNDGGSRTEVRGGFWQRTTSTNAAIKLPAADSITFGQRNFSNLYAAGGVLFDFAGSSMTIVEGCNFVSTASMWNSSSHQTVLMGNRIAGSVMTITGSGHLFSNNSMSADITIDGSATLIHMTGNNIAGSLTLNAGAATCRLANNTVQGTFTDNSAVGTNWLEYDATFTPTWGSDGTQPVLGDGTLTGYLQRRGNIVRVQIKLTPGSTTTFGTGGWYFNLPSPYNYTTKTGNDYMGAARFQDTGTAFYCGISRMGSGIAPKIYSTAYGVGGDTNATIPFTWANTDIYSVDISWEIS